MSILYLKDQQLTMSRWPTQNWVGSFIAMIIVSLGREQPWIMELILCKVKTSSGWSWVRSCIISKGARALDELANLAISFMGNGWPGRFVPPKRPGLLVIEIIVLKGLARWKTEKGTYCSFWISDCHRSSNMPTSSRSFSKYFRAVRKTKVWLDLNLHTFCAASNALEKTSGDSSIRSWNTYLTNAPLAQSLQQFGWVVSRRHTRRKQSVHTGPSSSTYVSYGIKQGKS